MEKDFKLSTLDGNTLTGTIDVFYGKQKVRRLLSLSPTMRQ
jgi:hypothetical protein